MNFRVCLSTLLFTLVALLSFAIWAVGSSLYRSETAMYSLCALVFFGLGGFALSPAAPRQDGKSLAGLSLRFAAGFALYALIWSVSWFQFRDTFGEIVGSFFGLLGLVAIFRGKQASGYGLLTATSVVFLWHTLGYYLGGQAYLALQNRGPLAMDLPFESKTVTTLARFSWGLFYGLGLGYGLSRLIHESKPR